MLHKALDGVARNCQSKTLFWIYAACKSGKAQWPYFSKKLESTNVLYKSPLRNETKKKAVCRLVSRQSTRSLRFLGLVDLRPRNVQHVRTSRWCPRDPALLVDVLHQHPPRMRPSVGRKRPYLHR